MNNTTTTRTTLSAIIVLLFIAATLVSGGILTATTTPSAAAFADGKKKGNGNGNGNTDTTQKNKQDGTESGFDNSFEQEGQNLICTHPDDNSNCIQEEEEELSSTAGTAGTSIASEVTGSGTAPNTSPNSRITCPNGSALAGTITFHATKTTGGVISGTWTIQASQIDLNGPPVGVKSGTFNGGDIGTNNYHLTGVENVDQACSQFGGGVTPNPITISGQCGTGVAIEFLANQLPQSPPGFPPFRESGTFTGNVNCVVSSST
jgi:hypothetical protein